MKQLIRWCDWELKNEFTASGYFCVMLFSYGMVELIYGKQEINVWVIVQMFLLNYVISTLHRIVFNQERDYDNKVYYKRAIALVVISSAAIVFVCHFFSWFEGCSIFAELFMYLCMIFSYFFVWLIARLMKTYDTKQLNEQLERFKKGAK